MTTSETITRYQCQNQPQPTKNKSNFVSLTTFFFLSTDNERMFNPVEGQGSLLFRVGCVKKLKLIR